MEKHGYNKAVRKIQQQRCGKEVIMSQKQVAGWLKGITLSIAGMGLLFFGLVVPYLAWDMAVTYPDYAALRIPGILYGWGIAVFCYAILYQFWKVCVQIGRLDRHF